MADSFISALTNELTAVDDGDMIAIDDVSANETKKLHPGTSITRDVQTSPTDTTAGRLMATGAGGLLSNSTEVGVPPGNDANNALLTRWYDIGSDTANTPFAGAGTLRAEGRNTNRVQQTAYRIAGQTTPEVYERHSFSVDPIQFSPWRRTFNEGNLLGTVSQSGGVPTGAVIQRGSNANGEFVRFADGTQICTISNFPVASINTAVGQIFRSGGQTWTTPAAFLSGATTSLQGYCQNLSVCSLASGFTTPSGSALPFSVIRPTSTTTETLWALVAIGRWF